MELLSMKFSPRPFYLVPLRPKYSSRNTLFSDTLGLRSSLNVSDQVSHTFKRRCKILFLYILILKILVANYKAIDSAPNGSNLLLISS
jgi:hypothetical protein